MEPTAREVQTKHEATLLRYVYNELTISVPDKVVKISIDNYPSRDDGDYIARNLCGTLTRLSPERLDEVVYEARKPMARQLADWWECHQEADRRRERAVEIKKKTKKLRKQALKKLTKKEIDALGIKA